MPSICPVIPLITPQVLRVHTVYFKFLLDKFLVNCFFFGLQVAVIAGNLDLANVIQRHKPDDVGKFFILFCSVDFLTRNIFA